MLLSIIIVAAVRLSFDMQGNQKCNIQLREFWFPLVTQTGSAA